MAVELGKKKSSSFKPEPFREFIAEELECGGAGGSELYTMEGLFMHICTRVMASKGPLYTGFCDSFCKGIIQCRISWPLLFGKRCFIIISLLLMKVVDKRGLFVNAQFLNKTAWVVGR